MPIFARFMNFCDFYDLRKGGNCIFGNFKNPNYRFWDPLFFFYLFKIFCFPLIHVSACKVEFRVQIERFFGFADTYKIRRISRGTGYTCAYVRNSNGTGYTCAYVRNSNGRLREEQYIYKAFIRQNTKYGILVHILYRQTILKSQIWNSFLICFALY